MKARITLIFVLWLGMNCQPTESSPVQTDVIFASIGTRSLKLEVANNPSTRAVGLMHRKEMGEDEGMLFVFPKSEYLSFWMKNTLIPLTVGYFSEDLRLLETHDMKPNQTTEVYNSLNPAKYALEVNQGWFAKNKIGKDAVLILEKKISARD
ncbi:DUF192 domain-containing protein [Leptospira sp. 'Mane']|uniref:DUF192 domain-containing protein n=1 Tax=Leptospira sp. 'Mane' TaxID=3387407 RepID=UPI00398AAC85